MMTSASPNSPVSFHSRLEQECGGEGHVRPAAVIVLAAGAGTRMKSELPKVLHPMCGEAMVGHALRAAHGTGAPHVVAVVRHKRDQVVSAIEALDSDVVFADQDDVPGTGRAVECGMEALAEDLTGTVVVTYGDVPLLQASTLRDLVASHEAGGHGVSIITAVLDDATGYGRIVRDGDGQIERIVEHKDALAQVDDAPHLVEIKETNSGIYAFDAALLRDMLTKITVANVQGEKYLTDTVELARAVGRSVNAFVLTDIEQAAGVNDRVQLSEMGRAMNQRILESHMRAGVTIVDTQTTWIDPTVAIAPDSTILPGTQLHGASRVETGATVGPDSTLINTTVGEDATVFRVHATDSEIGPEANVGPYTYLRPGTSLGRGGKLGTFVETKNSTIGEKSKVPHLTYIGDATIGRESNVGCASVTVNYDGVNKHRTVIGDHCRTGSDTMFVAPVTIGDGAYTGAGTVVRSDVPPGALAFTEGRQRTIDDWVIRRRPGTPAAEAAEKAKGEQS